MCPLLCPSGKYLEGCLGDHFRLSPSFSTCPGTSQGGWDPCAAVNHWIKVFESQGCAHWGAQMMATGTEAQGVAGDRDGTQCHHSSAG